jgi:hypothetical protein
MGAMETKGPHNAALKPSVKVGVVAGGYVAAALVAAAAVAVRLASTRGPDAQASSGMHAFGDVLLFVAVFGVAALVPTGAALLVLRSYRHFWTTLSTFALGVATTGLAAAALLAIARDAAPSSPLAMWAGFAVLRLVVSPLVALTSLVCVALSPSRFPRLAFLAVSVIEAAVTAYGGFVAFAPFFFPGGGDA